MDTTPIMQLVGLEKAKQMLIESAMVCEHENKQPPHIMLLGTSGCGKTSLARAFVKMVDGRLREYHGRQIADDKFMFSQLMINIRNLNPETKAFLFVDEVHRLKPLHQEIFYPIMENKNITLIAATTDIGKLVKPFQNRFSLIVHITDYSVQESVEIVNRYCDSINVRISPQAAKEIAHRGRGVARTLCDLVDRCNNKAKYVQLLKKSTCSGIEEGITTEIANLTFQDLEISANGLTTSEEKVLLLLTKNQQLSVRTLCSMTDIDLDQYEKNYEPYLIKLGFIEKTQKGRRITDEGIKYTRILVQEYDTW